MPRSITAAILRFLMLEFSSPDKSTRVTTTMRGQRIRVEIVENHTLVTRAGQRPIPSAFGKLAIERDRFRFDDAPWTLIPKGVRVDVSVSKGRLLLLVGPGLSARTGR